MNKDSADLQTRLYLSSIVVLALGLCCAALIYLTVEDVSASAVTYVVADGVSYPIAPSQSKVYVRELQRFGGKAAVLFDEFGRWFAGLWQGKTLALTVAWISIAVSLGLLFLGTYLPYAPKSDIRGIRGRDQPDR